MAIAVPFDSSGPVLKASRLCTVTRRDGVVVRFTDAQRPVTVGGHSYAANSGATLSAVKRALGAQTSSQIDAFATVGGIFDLYDVANKKFDFARVVIELFLRDDPTQRSIRFVGAVINVKFSPNDHAVSFECEGINLKSQAPFVPVYGAMCRTDLGSRLCGIPLLPPDVARATVYAAGARTRVRFASAGDPSDYGNRYLEAISASSATASSAPSFSSTVGDTVTDGGVVWQTKEAWTRAAKIASLTGNFTVVLDRDVDARAVDGWFQNGMIIMRSGYSLGTGFEISSWLQASKTLTTFMPSGAAGGSNLYAAGDWLEIIPGCDKRVDGGCIKFDNTRRFQGEPYYIGAVAASQSSF